MLAAWLLDGAADRISDGGWREEVSGFLTRLLMFLR